jgi:voltage-gated potassium channel
MDEEIKNVIQKTTASSRLLMARSQRMMNTDVIERRRSEGVQRSLRLLLNHPITNHGVFALILLSVVLLVLEVLYHDQLTIALGIAISYLFFIELMLRYIAARSKRQFFRVYWVDILSLLPLLLPDYALLRALRILRLFRIGPLIMGSDSRLSRLIKETAGEQLAIMSVVVMVVVGSVFVMASVEPDYNTMEGYFWWATMSIVAGEPIGVADLPQSLLGRSITLVIMLGSLTIFGVFTGTVSAVVTNRLRTGMSTTDAILDDLEGHTVVCGWNRSGPKLVTELIRTGTDAERHVVIIAEEKPDWGRELEASPRSHFLQGDYTRTDVLERAGIKRAGRAILLADRSIPSRSSQDRDARTVLAGMIIEKLHPGIFACAELISRDNEEHLRMAGVEEVVIGEEVTATLIATSVRVGGVTAFADEVFSNAYGNQFFKRAVPAAWAGRTFIDLQTELKTRYDLLLLAIESDAAEELDGRRTLTNPPANHQVAAGDRLIVIGTKEPKW